MLPVFMPETYRQNPPASSQFFGGNGAATPLSICPPLRPVALSLISLRPVVLTRKVIQAT